MTAALGFDVDLAPELPVRKRKGHLAITDRYPATSDSRFTSVGTRSIFRFARPVCFQGFPDALMPDELKAANPLGILRQIDGAFTREALPQ